MIFNKSFSEILGFLIKLIIDLFNSNKLWGGILVAIPTAIPVAPFKRIFGSLEGKTFGSKFCPS